VRALQCLFPPPHRLAPAKQKDPSHPGAHTYRLQIVKERAAPVARTRFSDPKFLKFRGRFGNQQQRGAIIARGKSYRKPSPPHPRRLRSTPRPPYAVRRPACAGDRDSANLAFPEGPAFRGAVGRPARKSNSCRPRGSTPCGEFP